MIRFLCECRRRIKLEDDLAGHLVQCSKCGARMRVPQAEPLSAPEALAAAMREATQPEPEEVETTEVAEEAPEAEPPADGLAALAHAVKSVPPGKTARRPGGLGARMGAPARPGSRPGQRNGRRPAPGANRMNPTLIGIMGGIAGVVVLIVILFLLAGGGSAPEDKPPTPEPPKAVSEAPKPKRFTGHQPGEMFREVPFEDERSGQPKPSAPKKP